jgi:predicted RNA-binding protein YlxR (DUF448 family)
VGCRRRAHVDLLVRCGFDQDAGVMVTGASPGRGAWLCRGSKTCLERAIKKNRFATAFRTTIPPEAVGGITKAFASVGSDARESMSPDDMGTDLCRAAKG